jgi:hypothetical protein
MPMRRTASPFPHSSREPYVTLNMGHRNTFSIQLQYKAILKILKDRTMNFLSSIPGSQHDNADALAALYANDRQIKEITFREVQAAQIRTLSSVRPRFVPGRGQPDHRRRVTAS